MAMAASSKRNMGMGTLCRIIFTTLIVTSCLDSASARVAAGASKVSTTPQKKNLPVDTKSEHPKWLEICNQLAPATSVMCSLAPLPTIFEISRKKSVGDLPLLPYSSMAANGFIWALYGWLTGSSSVKWANILGALLGTYYFTEFRKYTPAGSSNLPGTVKQHLYAVTWIILANTFALTNFTKKTASDVVGKEGVLMYIILFASPLASLKNVIATKSAASIALPFTIASTINCSLWSVVGLLYLKDVYITFPSMMGLLCALVQLFLKGMYNDDIAESAAVIQEMSELVNTHAA